MIICRRVRDLRLHLQRTRSPARRVGFVPTMGALHDGHLSLVRAAVAECDEVVVSIFVNPAQFDDVGDLHAYPRTEDEDLELAEAAGATVAFIPSVEDVYPPGGTTSVRVRGVSECWEGAARGPGHFDGVALVVCKLLNMVGPDLVWFGQKDAQQIAVVRRLVTDLDIDVQIRTGPTIREPDGLAMSSRNVRLGAADRAKAPALHRALQEMVSAAAGETATRQLCDRGKAVLRRDGLEAEYLAVVDPDTFEPVADVAARPGLAIVAAEVGGVRLIDNHRIDRPATDRRVDGDGIDTGTGTT